MSALRRLVAAAAIAVAVVPAAPAQAQCVGSVCVNAPYCGLCDLAERLLSFECSDDAQPVCDVRDLIYP